MITLTQQQLDKIKEILLPLRNSCYEGLDGSWDCSTSEGLESFQPMADDCEEIAKILGIDLPEYFPRALCDNCGFFDGRKEETSEGLKYICENCGNVIPETGGDDE